MHCRIFLSEEGLVGERLHSQGMRRHVFTVERERIAVVIANTCVPTD